MKMYILWVIIAAAVIFTTSLGQDYDDTDDESSLLATRRTEVPLVAFFHEENSEAEQAFRFAVEWINSDLSTVSLVPEVRVVSELDSFNISRTTCNLMNRGIGAVFGSQSPSTVGVIRSITERAHIPHIQTHWDVSSLQPSRISLNLYPSPSLLAQALKAIVKDMDWETYTVIYDDDSALIRLQELIKVARELTAEGRVPFTAWQLPKKGIGDEEPDYRPLLKEVQKIGGAKIVLDCSVDKILPIFQQAKEVNMMDDYNSYILTTLDAHTIDYGEFKSGSTNITAIRLTDVTGNAYQAAYQDWKADELAKGRILSIKPDAIRTDVALIYDAVNVFGRAIQEFKEELQIQSTPCSSQQEVWTQGMRLSRLMKSTEMEGMTGRMTFDENGLRKFFSVDISQLTKTGFRKIGAWNTDGVITYTRTTTEMSNELQLSMANRTFIVVSRLGEPYLSIRVPNAEGNDRFEGYSKDLIAEIAKDLNFNYKLVIVADNKYGAFNKETKQWDGLIRELKDRRAHLAICDLTITYERRSAVDFTKPFMTLGISILYSKPLERPPDLFSFLLPFSINVWICVATVYLGVSLHLYVLSRIAAPEWKNPRPCEPCPEELENQCKMLNAFWHNTGSIMQQGSDHAPQAISTRVVAALWWFFVLIMASSYTANLAASLTMSRMESTIQNVEDLGSQTKIKYGALAGGSTFNFFRDSNNSLYHKMFSIMESSRPAVFTKTNDEGVERVLKGNRMFAFFMESTTIEYQVEKHCDLMQVGGLLDSKGYGIAMTQNFQYRIPISGSILKMQESGKLAELKDKWWKQSHGKPPCSAQADKDSDNSDELGIEEVGGVFLVVIAGCGASFIVSLLEFLWSVIKVAVNEEIPLSEAFALELRFALSLNPTKPVRYTPVKPASGYDEGSFDGLSYNFASTANSSFRINLFPETSHEED